MHHILVYLLFTIFRHHQFRNCTILSIIHMLHMNNAFRTLKKRYICIFKLLFQDIQGYFFPSRGRMYLIVISNVRMPININSLLMISLDILEDLSSLVMRKSCLDTVTLLFHTGFKLSLLKTNILTTLMKSTF